MAKRKKLNKPQIPPLEPIIYDKNLSSFDLRHYIEVFRIKLVLADYDWMNYKLFVALVTKEYGAMEIEFEYFGANFSVMTVETEEGKYSFKFNTDLFQEHIIIFIQKHMKSWRESHEFNGTEEVIDFYNDVLTYPHTVEERRQIPRKRK